MTVADRIKRRREELGYTQDELAKKMGYTGKSSVSKIESSGNNVTLKMVNRAAKALETTSRHLMGWGGEASAPITKTALSKKDMQIAYAYHQAEPARQAIVDDVLKLDTLPDSVMEAPAQYETSICYPYYGKIAAAGKSFDSLSDIMQGTIEVRDTPFNRRGDYVIGVSGDSMEPTFYDGDKVLVVQTDHIDIGNIGIFQMNNEVYIKEAGESSLISHNSRYSPITDDVPVYCLGRVLGKVEE